MKKIVNKISILALVVALMLSFSGCSLFQAKNINSADNLPDSTFAAQNVVFNTETSGRTLMAREDAIAKVERSIVAIKMESSSSVSYGSGVIVDMSINNSSNENEFYIITCHHVISSTGNITVYIPDNECDNVGESDYDDSFVFTGVIGGKNRNYSVILVGGDATSDIAVLKLTVDSSFAKNIVKSPVAPLDSNIYQIKKGQEVFAIGNPAGALPGTTSVGTISYINRETSINPVGAMTLLQINVDTYHGSSGGGLFNMYGELIGITNAGNDEYSGLNYAIPYVINPLNGSADNGFANIVQHLLGTFTENNYGYVSGRLQKFGFVGQQETMNTASGVVDVVRVSSVESGSKAAASGMQVGDIVTKASINGGEAISISKLNDLSGAMQSLKIGDTITLEVERVYFRGYETLTLQAMTAEQLVFCDTGIYA